MYPTPIYRHLVPLSVKIRKKYIPIESRVIFLASGWGDTQSEVRAAISSTSRKIAKTNVVYKRKAAYAKGKDDVNGRYYRNSSAFRTGMRPSSFPPFRPFSTERLFRVLEGHDRAPLTEIPAFAYQGTATV